MAATPVMPATTAVEDLLKHFGTRYGGSPIAELARFRCVLD